MDDSDDDNGMVTHKSRLKTLNKVTVHFQAYAEKKSKKPAVIAKSSILLEVKPWDDETSMTELEKCVR